MDAYIWFAVIIGCCLGIMKSCDFFELGAEYVGRNMSAGAKGALINALGSSMPELLVTLAFVLTGKPELILAGIAVTAGSAIFNAVLIPAFAILYAGDGKGNKVESFELSRKVLMRDGAYLLLIEGLLIWMLGLPAFTPWMVALLLASYTVYACHVMRDSRKAGEKTEEYEGEIQTGGKAWLYLGGAMAALGVLCHFLALGIENVAHAFNWPVYIVAVVLGAAATSLPDTILSVKSAKEGEFEDAVGNAIGSNIFDVTGALAIPMLVAMVILFFQGETMSLPIQQSAGLMGLRVFVWGTSALVVGALLACANNINKKMSWFLFAVYCVWVGYLIF
jgi:cation:H+ antiporter